MNEKYKQLGLGFDLTSDLAKYPCADVQEMFQRTYPTEHDETENSADLYFPEEPEIKTVVPKLWGLRKEDLARFNRDTLESIFYGTHNLWVPTEMLDLENPAEIVANYLASGIVKRYNSHKGNSNIPHGSFGDLVKYLNRLAYDNPIFRVNSRTFKTRFPTTPGRQEERLALLPGEVKRKFCASFWRDYNPSRREEPENYEAFYDPGTHTGYINFIYQHLKRRFEREHTEK